MDKIETIQEDDVILSFKEDTVHISGNIVQMKPELYMQNFFKELHQYVLEHKVKRIYVNITKLKFLNSAGIKVLIDWVILITELPEDEKYQLFFYLQFKIFLAGNQHQYVSYYRFSYCELYTFIKKCNK